MRPPCANTSFDIPVKRCGTLSLHVKQVRQSEQVVRCERRSDASWIRLLADVIVALAAPPSEVEYITHGVLVPHLPQVLKPQERCQDVTTPLARACAGVVTTTHGSEHIARLGSKMRGCVAVELLYHHLGARFAKPWVIGLVWQARDQHDQVRPNS